MKIIKEKIVTTRIRSVCCGCLRVIPAGTTMRVVTVVYDGINNWRECLTCMELLKKDPKRFDDGFGVFEYGCVDVALNQEQTPEMLLAELG